MEKMGAHGKTSGDVFALFRHLKEVQPETNGFYEEFERHNDAKKTRIATLGNPMDISPEMSWALALDFIRTIRKEDQPIVIRPIARRGIVYAEKSFLPALGKFDWYPDTKDPQEIRQTFLDDWVQETSTRMRTSEPQWTTYVRRDVHMMKPDVSAQALPTVSDDAASMVVAGPHTDVWYDDRIKKGETMLALALHYARHPELLKDLKKILIVAHRDDAGISHLCSDPAWHPVLGHPGLEKAIADSPDFQQYYDEIKNAGVFERIPQFDWDYEGMLREKRLSDFMATTMTKSQRLQLLQFGHAQGLVAYARKTGRIAVWPSLSDIEALMVEWGIPSLYHAGLRFSSEKETVAMRNYFGMSGIPLYYPERIDTQTFMQWQKNRTKRTPEFIEDIRASLQKGYRYPLSKPERIFTRGVELFLSRVSPQISGFLYDRRDEKKPASLRVVFEKDDLLSKYYARFLCEDLKKKRFDVEERSRYFLDELMYSPCSVALVTTQRDPDLKEILSLGERAMEHGARGVRFVFAYGIPPLTRPGYMPHVATKEQIVAALGSGEVMHE